MKSKIWMLLFVSMVMGCSAIPKEQPIIVQTDLRPIEVLHPPLPEPITWLEVKWMALTPDIMRELLKKHENRELSEKDLSFSVLHQMIMNTFL